MSRNTQTQSSTGSGGDDEAMLKKKAIECVEYILFCVLADRKSIVRKADLNKNVIKDYSRQFKTVFDLTRAHLRDTFGLIVIDLDDNDRSERFGIRSKYQFDSDLNKLELADAGRHLREYSATASTAEVDREFEDQLKYSVLLIALSLIFMNGNEIDAGTFWESMRRVDLNKDDKRHKYLGDVFKYFTVDLVKEGYLEHEQVSTDPPAHRFRWGYRAKLEITKRAVLDFVCELYGGKDVCKPSEWMSQFADANKTDRFNTGEDNDEEGGDRNETQDDDDDNDEMETEAVTATASSQQRRGGADRGFTSQPSQRIR
jgi:hypothetical protein